MLRTPFRLVGTGCLAIILIASAAVAADADTKAAHSFKVTITSKLEMEVEGKKQKVDTVTELHYTWQRGRGDRTLSLGSSFVKVNADGKPLMNSFMSRKKVTNTAEGRTDEVTFDEATDELKKVLQDSYSAPLCKLRVDENGREVKRTVVAGPGAKAVIDNGMIAIALLFHPPFMRGRDEWQAETEVSMGNGGFAKGKLTYKKVAGGKGGQAVQVSGTLTNESFQWPDKPVTIRNAKYAVRGEQTYDPAVGEWISGKLTVDVSFRMTAGKSDSSAKGVSIWTFEKLPGNE